MAGTPTEPLPVDTSKTEPKVKVSALVQYLGGLVLLAIITGAMDGNLIAFLPDWASTVLVPVLPTAAAWLAAYNTRHQYRAPETVR